MRGTGVSEGQWRRGAGDPADADAGADDDGFRDDGDSDG